MYKQKTKCAAKKRFKVTGSGKIKRKHAYKSHLLGHKAKRQKRELGKFVDVNPASMEAVKKALAIK